MKRVITALAVCITLHFISLNTYANSSSRPNFALKQLQHNNTSHRDHFGNSLAVAGDFAMVGARGDSEKANNAGAVYLYWYFAYTWNNTAKLMLPDAQANDNFGHAIAMDENAAIISTYSSKNGRQNAAYIYERRNYEWILSAKLTPSDGKAFDYFGTSVAISDKYAIVGANGVDDNGNNSGAVYIYKRDDIHGWQEAAKLTAEDAEANDYFGCSVDIKDKFAIVGASGKNKQQGAAYIFKRKRNSWKEYAKLSVADLENGDNFGNSVAISDDIALIGACNYDGPGNMQTDSGIVYVFDYSMDKPDVLKTLNAPERVAHSRFGYTVDLCNNKAAVSAYGIEQLIHGDAKAAYIFGGLYSEHSTSKTLNAYAANKDSAPINVFGNSVAISGNKKIAGVFMDESSGRSMPTYAFLPAYDDY